MKRTRISTRAGSESFLPEELLSFYLFNDTGIKRNLHEARSENKSQNREKKRRRRRRRLFARNNELNIDSCCTKKKNFFSTVLPTYDKILTIRTKCDLAEKENRIYIYISIVTNEKEFFLKWQLQRLTIEFEKEKLEGKEKVGLGCKMTSVWN